MSTNSLILLSPEVELNFSPLEYGLNLVTYFQRIEYGKEKKKETSHWRKLTNTIFTTFVAVQLLSCVQLFETPRTAAHQASLSVTISWGLLKLVSIELVIPSNHLILCHPLLLCLQPFPASGSFPMISSLHQVTIVLELQLHHQSFWRIFRVDFL